MKKYLCIITIFPLLFIFLMECASSKETLVYIVTWESDVRITNSGDNSILPTLGTSNGTLHLAWADARDGVENREVYYNRSTDNGTTWQSTDVRISHDPAYSIKPDFTANGDTVNLFWRDNRDGNYEIYMVHSEDDGISWGPETKITQDPGYSGCPFLASHGNTLHLFWRDNRLGTFKIYYKRSTDAGHTWGSDILLTPDGIMAEFPFIALNGDTLHLVWRDKRNGDPDIYYKRSIDGGNNWTEDIRLTDNTSESEHPKISVQNNNIFVTWRDDRDGSYNVYYKTSTDNGMTWSSDTK